MYFDDFIAQQIMKINDLSSSHDVDAAAPWGGFRSSGWGREMGRGAIDLYTETRSVWVSLA